MYQEKRLLNGFLDEDFKLEVAKMRRENDDLYKVIEKINKLFYSIEEKYEKTKPTEVDVYIRTTFSQIHMSSQSYIILLERGLYDDSQVILRSMYDKVIKCLYAIKNNSIDILIQDSIKRKKSLYDFIDKNEMYNYVPKEKLYNMRAELEKEQKKDENGKNLKIPQIIETFSDLGIKEVYIHYKLLSSYVHNSIDVIGNKVIEDGIDILINQNIEHGDFRNEIVKMYLCMQYIVGPICEYLNLRKQKLEFNNLIKELIKLTEKNML